MPLRVVLNRVYRLLTANLDMEGREKFDSDLYAPEEGWDALESRLFANMAEAIGEVAE